MRLAGLACRVSMVSLVDVGGGGDHPFPGLFIEIEYLEEIGGGGGVGLGVGRKGFFDDSNGNLNGFRIVVVQGPIGLGVLQELDDGCRQTLDRWI